MALSNVLHVHISSKEEEMDWIGSSELHQPQIAYRVSGRISAETYRNMRIQNELLVENKLRQRADFISNPHDSLGESPPHQIIRSIKQHEAARKRDQLLC